MSKPPVFKGKPDEEFFTWFQTIQIYFRYHASNFPTGQDKVDWIACLLQDGALRWYQGRTVMLLTNRKKDNWPSFASAMHERFTDALMKKRYLDRLMMVQYQGHVQEYL